MLELSTPFLWNGVDNLVVDTSFDLVSSFDESGSVQFSSVPNGYRYIRSDSANQSQTFSGGSVTSNRPNLRLIFEPSNLEPVELSITRINNMIELSWNHVAGARQYHIYRANEPHGDYVLIASTVNSSFTDAITENKRFYKVVASSNFLE